MSKTIISPLKRIIMKKLFILPLLLASFIVTACVEDDSIVKPDESLVEPLNITLSLSQSGERQVDLNKTRPSFSFKIEKSHPFVETTASLSVISAEELGNGYLPLADNLYRISSTELEFAEDEQSQSVNILFTNLEQLEPATNYALGLKLTSSSTRIEVPAGQERLILILNVGEGGTLRNPYRLRTLDDLKEMGSLLKPDVTVCFKMEEDIDMQSEEWTPLNRDGRFHINFDGNNHTISNLKCTQGTFPSFFGQLVGSCRNVTFKNVEISGYQTPTGAIAGFIPNGAADTEISNTHVINGTLNQVENGRDHWSTGSVGGIVGDMRAGRISECSAKVDITGEWCTGGLAGQLVEATIEKSFYEGTVYSRYSAGGIAGSVHGALISDCYSHGSVSTLSSFDGEFTGPAGGIAARMYVGSNVRNCYSTATVKGHASAGGIAGQCQLGEGSADNSNYIVNCVAWNDYISSTTDIASGRICGWMPRGNGTNGNKGESCYAKEVDVIVKGNPLAGDDIRPSASFDTTHANSLRYHGLIATDLIDVTQNTLGWSMEIWDFSGEKPQFNWQSTAN